MVARTVAGETLLVPVRGNVAQCDHIFILNQTGGYLWSLLDGAHTVEDLVQRVEEAFEDAPPDAARRDVASFLEAMSERGLIEWEPPREQ